MIKVIHAGKHRAKPRTLKLYWDQKVIQYSISFDKSCRYMVDAEGDINKLFGIGYFPSHHVDSARFGWRYSPTNGKIEIMSYCYSKGERSFQHLCYVDFDKDYFYTIIIRPTEYQFICDSYSIAVPKRHEKKLGFGLGVWFGGNLPSPHKMLISFK